MKEVPAKLGDLVIHQRASHEVVITEVWAVVDDTPTVIGWGDTFILNPKRSNSFLAVREALKRSAIKLVGKKHDSVRSANNVLLKHSRGRKMFREVGLARRREKRNQK